MAQTQDRNRHLLKVIRTTMDMTTAELAAAARKACKLTIRSTAAGAWLSVCILRMERLDGLMESRRHSRQEDGSC